MKFCLNYRKAHEKLMMSADELNITYNKKDTTLVDFLELYMGKRINIKIEDLEDFKATDEINKIAAIVEKYSDINISLKLPKVDMEFIDLLKEKNIPYFIGTFVNNWDVFRGLINLGVTDIYIVEDLGFELDTCSKIAHENHVKIRVFPNIAQSTWKNSEPIKKFFIRPEDVIQYEPYVDVIEFMGNVEKEGVLLEIYRDNKEWFGPLYELISDLDSEIDSRFIIPRFAETRIKCGKRCLKGAPCTMCNTVDTLSKTLKDRNLIVTNIKEIEDIEE